MSVERKDLTTVLVWGWTWTSDIAFVFPAKKIEAAMTPEEKAKLYRAIDYNENAAPAIYPVTFVENRLSFKMNSLDIRLKNDDIESGTILLSSLQEVNALVEQRKSGQALK